MLDRGIERIELENIGKFESFRLALQDGDIVELRGENDLGKSTILEAVEATIYGELSGKTSEKSDAPHATGTLTVEINGYEITRVVQNGKTKYLEVKDKDGNRPYEGNAVQTFLSSIFPKGQFVNPFKLMDLKGKDRIRYILAGIPIDLQYAQERLKVICNAEVLLADNAACLETIKRLHDNLYKERAEVNAKLKVKISGEKAAIEAIPTDYDPETPPPTKPAPMTALYEQREKIRQANTRHGELARRRTETLKELEQIRARLNVLEANLQGIEHEMSSLPAQQDTAEIDAQIDGYEKLLQDYQRACEVHGDRLLRYQQAKQLGEEVETVRKEHGTLDGQVKALDKLPADLFARAELPIKGMYIEGDSIMLPNPTTGELRPVEEFGDAAQLDTFIALAMAIAPAPFILADGLERCGKKRSEEIYDRIRAKGFQLLATRVTDEPLQVVKVDVGGKAETLPVEIAESQQDFDFDLDVPEL